MKTSKLLTTTLFALTLGACSSSPKEQEPVEAQQMPPNTPTAPHIPEMEETPATPKETVTEAPKAPKEAPAQPKEETPKKEEPVVEEKPKAEPVVVEPTPVEPVVTPVGKCQFVALRNVAHDFEIKCSSKIQNIVYGRMTVGQSLNIQANGVDIQIAKHDEHTIEGSVKASHDVMITLVFEDESRQDIEFQGDKVVFK